MTANNNNLQDYATVKVTLEVEVKLTPEVIEAFEENGDHDAFVADIVDHYSQDSTFRVWEWEDNGWCDSDEIELTHKWSAQRN
tara:strand:+ start:1067 stop:1315 length:249 start_codon:yes stop_codon:yes gene_type:complete